MRAADRLVPAWGKLQVVWVMLSRKDHLVWMYYCLLATIYRFLVLQPSEGLGNMGSALTWIWAGWQDQNISQKAIYGPYVLPGSGLSCVQSIYQNLQGAQKDIS